MVSLEKVLEEAFLKVAQEEAQDLPVNNAIESWLSEQEDVVRRPESIGWRSETASHVSCAHHCSCWKEIALLAAENEAIKINQEKLFSFLTMGRSFARPRSHLPDPPDGSTSSVADEGTRFFSLAPTTESKAEEQKEKREKLKERVFESKNAQRVSEARNKKKKEVLAEKRATDPMIAAQVLLAQSLLGAAGASGAAQVNPILAGGGGIEDVINPGRAKLRAIAKEPKYNGNPRRWAVFKREFSLWFGKNKLQDDEKLDALLECLEGPMTGGLNPTLIGLNLLTHSPTVNCLLCLRDEDVGCLKTITETSPPLSRTFPSSSFPRFRISVNALRIW